MNLVVTIPGRPVPKGRPRFYKGHAVTPQKTRAAEQAAKIIARSAMNAAGRRLVWHGPVEMEILFSYKARRTKDGFTFRPMRPDLDNLVKLVKDSFNGVVWGDDAQVVCLKASKRWGLADETTVFVNGLEGGE